MLFTTAVVTAYDYMLDQPDLLGIDVVNNSWGNSYRQYDPRDPVAVATKAVADQGVTVVFAAGNSGAEQVSASLNPFSQSPWVISVAAGTIDRHRGDFSSNGLVYDDSQATAIGAGGHTTYTGDRIGLVHPDITAPGVDISSTCDTLGSVIGPCPPGNNATASGTSMASPHIAGAAAVLKQAQPESPRPRCVRPCRRPRAGDGRRRQGRGAVLAGRLRLRQPRQGGGPGAWRRAGRPGLAKPPAPPNTRVLAADGQEVLRSDFWTYDSPRDHRRRLGHPHVQAVRWASDLRSCSSASPTPRSATVGANLLSYTAR